MTLILSNASWVAVQQVSDRTVVAGTTEYSKVFNKAVVYVATDGVAIFGYAGAAYMHVGVPTDVWLARVLTGEPRLRELTKAELADVRLWSKATQEGALMGMRAGLHPESGSDMHGALKRVQQAVAEEFKKPSFVRFPRLQISVAGWWWSRRRGPSRPFVLRLCEPNGDLEARSPRWIDFKQFNLIPAGRTDLVRREALLNDLAKDPERDWWKAAQRLVAEVKHASTLDREVGPNVLHGTLFPIPPRRDPYGLYGTQPVLGTNPGPVHAVFGYDRAPESDPDAVIYAPWFVSPEYVVAPQVISGLPTIHMLNGLAFFVAGTGQRGARGELWSMRPVPRPTGR